jgi:hypothetical protein
VTALVDGLLWRPVSGKHAHRLKDLALAITRYHQRTGRVADCVEVHPSELDLWSNLGLLAIGSVSVQRGHILVGRLR